MRDIETKYPGMEQIKERYNGSHKNYIRIDKDGVKASLAWFLHNEPMIEALDDFEKTKQWKPELLWVLEDDVGFTGKEDKGMR